ncbi:hypothetical protein LguiA_022491 [Lonicera macranthoides]
MNGTVQFGRGDLFLKFESSKQSIELRVHLQTLIQKPRRRGRRIRILTATTNSLRSSEVPILRIRTSPEEKYLQN